MYLDSEKPFYVHFTPFLEVALRSFLSCSAFASFINSSSMPYPSLSNSSVRESTIGCALDQKSCHLPSLTISPDIASVPGVRPSKCPLHNGTKASERSNTRACCVRIDARAGMVDMSFVTVLVRIPMAYRARPISDPAATGAELKAYKK